MELARLGGGGPALFSCQAQSVNNRAGAATAW